MPPDVVVETYVPCPDGALPTLVGRFSALLERLGYTGRDPEFWAADMGWDDEDHSFGPTAHRPSPVRGLALAGGDDLSARASMIGWSPASVPGLRGHWLGLSLDFETEGSEQYLVTSSAFAAEPGSYVEGVGHALWRVMRAFAAEFSGAPVYCSFEGWEGDAWEALETGVGQLWSFDAALIPSDLADRFAPVPDEYAGETVPEGLALASRAAWPTLPWREAH